MFRGTFEQKVDDKGRVNIPSKFRDVFRDLGDDRLVITNLLMGQVRCLDARPYGEWMKFESSIAERTDLSPEAREYFDNFLLPGAHECQIDAQGRLLVPPTLRAYASLVKDVVFTGALNRFRIWDKAKWESVSSAGERLGSEARVRTEVGI